MSKKLVDLLVFKVMFKVLAAVIILALVYLLCDSLTARDSMAAKYVSAADATSTFSSKKNFVTLYENYVEETGYMPSESFEYGISNKLFTSTQVRLNTEIYQITESVVNESNVSLAYSSDNSELVRSIIEYINPIMFITLATCETVSYNDFEYTWAPVIYSRAITNELRVNSDMFEFPSVKEVDSQWYIEHIISMQIKAMFNCGANCSCASAASESNKAGHVEKGVNEQANDNSSLGPLQILRHYMKWDVGSTYPVMRPYTCVKLKTEITDLFKWEDNVTYALERVLENFNSNSRLCDERIMNEYQLMAMIALMHNAGAGYLVSGEDIGNCGNFKSKQAVYDYAKAITSAEAVNAMQSIVDDWYESNIEEFASGNWVLPGNIYCDCAPADDYLYAELMESIGVNYKEYLASGVEGNSVGSTVKNEYPVKALINYMALKKLYSSEGEY